MSKIPENLGNPNNVPTEPVPSKEFADANLKPFQDVLQARRSIRIYDGERIPEETMREILSETIQFSPSSSNLQPWEFYWVRSEDKRKALHEACLNQPAAKTAGEIIVCVTTPKLWKTRLDTLLGIMKKGSKDGELPKSVSYYYEKLIPTIHKDDPLGLNNIFRKAYFFKKGLKEPIVRSPTNQGDHRVWAHVQTALACQTLMLSFTAHGYDTCPMGGFDEVRVKKALNLSNEKEVCMVISAGTRKPEGLYGPRVRVPDADVIFEV